ncbi:hypothetical protein PB1_00415 [Bacillus methanolicus PB1]|uniref:Uncharacterized protein n=1 Tax=Bacillus methanolicus PB1 TaxID=997296 RepID=I3E4E1_BACMT|nr:hypothetical protein PB1_00415 [Bacillus methanolicus PB1]
MVNKVRFCHEKKTKNPERKKYKAIFCHNGRKDLKFF